MRWGGKDDLYILSVLHLTRHKSPPNLDFSMVDAILDYARTEGIVQASQDKRV